MSLVEILTHWGGQLTIYSEVKLIHLNRWWLHTPVFRESPCPCYCKKVLIGSLVLKSIISSTTKDFFNFFISLKVSLQKPSLPLLMPSFSPSLLYLQLIYAWSACNEDFSGAHWANPILSVSGSWESSPLSTLDWWGLETLRSTNSLSQSTSSDYISIQT